ncbi:hypothetical protein KSU1_D0495 [Candidatus Jettenia caeni]|uniref:Uncharacterized protein n=1 Tax=Candidatus Jettenia caeni TaxID=247490 RepID=I3IQ09_9BACT|nr:MAG: hypothetical protein EDM77_15585 [Candidatus Jettenia sp. AMX1]MCE7881456.1 hypothetical protein [Candidatus Jettenia sp. AMX1]MCQ3928012.1 hypothetical protein [Candidatus Jettenia sp.]GAB63804.1 hypothetical protein KSU1_D0495 [Candidatus Jettenia caeni]
MIEKRRRHVSVLKRKGLGSCQRGDTGIVNSLSETKEIPTFPPFLKGDQGGLLLLCFALGFGLPAMTVKR